MPASERCTVELEHRAWLNETATICLLREQWYERGLPWRDRSRIIDMPRGRNVKEEAPSPVNGTYGAKVD